MSPLYNVALVGATGLVGRTMLKVLEERNFPVRTMIAVASEKSAGELLRFKGQPLRVKALSPKVFKGVDIALFSAGASVSKEFVPIAAKAGAVVVDNSSAWRMDPEVPLIVPEVNPGALKKHHRIIANPNCSTIQMVVALFPLHHHFKIRRIVVSTYQAVTGSGRLAVEQLKEEIRHGRSNNPVYPYRIAYNCLPHIDVFFEDGYTREEYKMIAETRKIMGAPSLPISATCVRVPVLGGHSESINVTFEKPFELQEIHTILESAPGISVRDNPSANRYPMPVDAENTDEVFVGRIRRDPSIPNGLNLWVVSDNLRKGAATNAVQIAERVFAIQENSANV